MPELVTARLERYAILYQTNLNACISTQSGGCYLWHTFSLPSALNSPTVIDQQAIATYFGGDTSLLRKFASIFVEEAPRLVNAMDEAYSSRDMAALEIQAHTLKSQVRYFGYLDIVNCLQEIESLAEARAPQEHLTPHMEVFNRGFPEVYKALTELVAL